PRRASAGHWSRFHPQTRSLYNGAGETGSAWECGYVLPGHSSPSAPRRSILRNCFKKGSDPLNSKGSDPFLKQFLTGILTCNRRSSERESGFVGRGLSRVRTLRASVTSPVVHLFLTRSRKGRVSQRRTVKSPEPETRRVPSGLNATEYT